MYFISFYIMDVYIIFAILLFFVKSYFQGVGNANKKTIHKWINAKKYNVAIFLLRKNCNRIYQWFSPLPIFNVDSHRTGAYSTIVRNIETGVGRGNSHDYHFAIPLKVFCALVC